MNISNRELSSYMNKPQNKKESRVRVSVPSNNIHLNVRFIGDKTLPLNILARLVCDNYLSTNTSVTSLDDLKSLVSIESEKSFYENNLFLFDCSSLSAEDINSILELSKEQGFLLKAALINVKKDSDHENLAAWSQITGIFSDKLEAKLLLSGLNQVIEGGLWFPRPVMEKLLEKGIKRTSSAHVSKPPVKLTKREIQILEMLAEGSTNNSIANSLFLSEHTIKTHLYNIYRKVNVKNRTQAGNWIKQYQQN